MAQVEFRVESVELRRTEQPRVHDAVADQQVDSVNGLLIRPNRLASSDRDRRLHARRSPTI
jgi:hypothetical protein